MDPVSHEEYDDYFHHLTSPMMGAIREPPSPIKSTMNLAFLAETSSNSTLFPLKSSRAASISPSKRDFVDRLVKLKVKDSKIAPLLGNKTLAEK